jgi:hypothetical protein
VKSTYVITPVILEKPNNIGELLTPLFQKNYDEHEILIGKLERFKSAGIDLIPA